MTFRFSSYGKHEHVDTVIMLESSLHLPARNDTRLIHKGKTHTKTSCQLKKLDDSGRTSSTGVCLTRPTPPFGDHASWFAEDAYR